MDDDEVWEEDEILDNATHCPSCEEMTAHDILHEKKVGDGADFKVRCTECERAHRRVSAATSNQHSLHPHRWTAVQSRGFGG